MWVQPCRDHRVSGRRHHLHVHRLRRGPLAPLLGRQPRRAGGGDGFCDAVGDVARQAAGGDGFAHLHGQLRVVAADQGPA